MEDTNIHLMIKKRFAKLPPKLQEAITSTEVVEKLRLLSKKYKLLLDKGQILENETYMVLLGIEQAEKYEENLKKELEISAEDAKKISNDVARDIFLSIRNLLKIATTPEIDNKITNNVSIPHITSPEPINIGTSKSAQPIQTAEPKPIFTKDKLNSIVKNRSKDIEVSQIKKYVVDPYREPIS